MKQELIKRMAGVCIWLGCASGLVLASDGKERAQLSGAIPVNERATDSQAQSVSHLDLYNPTDWSGPIVVEMPTGRLAAPGRIDWHAVQLRCGGKAIPFSIREGHPHWKARLVAPVERPRAEDRLVFSVTVPPKTWIRLNVVPGKPPHRSALKRGPGNLKIRYADFAVTIAEATGMLQQIAFAGQDILGGPLSVTFHAVKDDRDVSSIRTPVLPTGHARQPHARLVSSSSTRAMTELNFVLDAGGGLKCALTYRIHAAGLIEMWFDERPWRGTSPWLRYSAKQRLRIRGKREPLAGLQNRAPYYGFADYADVVKMPAAVYRLGSAAVVELGEALANGRRWNRRLYLVPPDRLDRLSSLIEAANEGLVVRVAPQCMTWPSKTVTIHSTGESDLPAAKLTDAFAAAGVKPKARTDRQEAQPGKPGSVVLRIVPNAAAEGIDGDGFVIRSGDTGRGLDVIAGTRFGLTQAVLRLEKGITRRGDAVRMPIIAENPAVCRRAGGFGGGPHEVDFPYGNEAEWFRTLDELIASGMNVMADLGMWSNWKTPVTFKYMPELRSDSPDAVDELTGAKFSEIVTYRDRALRLLDHLNQAGVTVWVWLPIGCAPSTFFEAYPEAESPRKGRPTHHGSGRIPCHSHPKYREYVRAFLRETLETYPVGGFVLIRDDNGGVCDCQRCQAALKTARVKDLVWSQYLVIYDTLRSLGFQGDIAVYPYHDLYRPSLDPLLPDDLLIVGHGSARALLVRRYDRIGPMGDTWLDNLYAPFRVPVTARMKRLLADRPSFWIGGAYRGCELTWQSIGRFGWDASRSVNTLRYEWAAERFGERNALACLQALDAFERLRQIYNVPMLPANWIQLDAEARRRVGREVHRWVERFRSRLTALEEAADTRRNADWLAHVRLYAAFVEYHLRRLELFSEMLALVTAHRRAAGRPEPLAPEVRARLIDDFRAIFRAAEPFRRHAASVGGSMMRETQPLLPPFGERMGGYEPWKLDPQLGIHQFAGSLTVQPVKLRVGKPFELALDLQNTGLFPWVAGTGMRIELKGDVEKLGLPHIWNYRGEPMAFGDRRIVRLKGTAPKMPGQAQITFELLSEFRQASRFARGHVVLRWDK